jgi:hypothetical protein
MDTAELERWADLLTRLPPGFRMRLERVLSQALDDPDDGVIELRAEVAGRGSRRGLREWKAHFSATGRPNGPREAA